MRTSTNKRILGREERLGLEAEALIAQIRERARNLYLTRQLLCTEAVMVALNHGLKGGLSDAQAVAMAAPFSVAMGESGCMCGALSGAVMASGLFLGNERPHRHRREIRDSARQLHDTFKAANGATCCSVLSRKIKHNKHDHFLHCADLTAESAELAARLILRKRPELLEQVDNNFLFKRQSMIGGALSRLIHFFVH